MGRKTYESIGKPLPNRRSIIITRDPDYKVEGCEVVNSLEEALLLSNNYEGQTGYWGNYQEANQIAILGFSKYTLTNLKFILKQVFNVGNGQSVMMVDRDGNFKKVYDEDTFGSGDSVYSEEKKIIKLGFPCEEFENVHWKGN